MNKRFIALHLILTTLPAGLVGCRHVPDAPLPVTENSWSVSKHSDFTGLDYEETESGFKAALLNVENSDYIPDKVMEWITEKPAGKEYYVYVCSDPDSWEMYIYRSH